MVHTHEAIMMVFIKVNFLSFIHGMANNSAGSVLYRLIRFRDEITKQTDSHWLASYLSLIYQQIGDFFQIGHLIFPRLNY